MVERREGSAHVRGRVRGVDRHTQSSYSEHGTSHVQTLTFRLDRAGAAGEPLPPVPVMLRGRSINGLVSDGDDVEVEGTWRKGTLRASAIVNLTDGGAVVDADPLYPWYMWIFIALFAVVFIAIAAFIVSGILSF